jgi:hypothetical protein
MEITMTSRLLLVSLAALAAPFVAQQAAAQSTLPANLQTDRATIQEDHALVKSAMTQLRTDEAAGNAAAVAADRTGLRLARMKVGEDIQTLHQDAQPVLQPERTTLVAALTQLHADQVANNAAAVQADQAAVEAAGKQLTTDRKAIFAGLGEGFGKHRGHHRG